MRPRLLRHPLERWVDPERAFAALHADADPAFWLDGGRGAESGHSFMGAGGRLLRAEPGEPFLPRLRAAMAEARLPADARTPFPLGWVGWLGYELRGETMEAPVKRRGRHPDAAWTRVDRALHFDHAERSVALLAIDGASEPGDAWPPELEAWRAGTVRRLAGLSPHPPTPPELPDPGAVRWADDEARYLEEIAACQRAIADGEAYQLCLTTEARLDVRPDALAVYSRLRAASPSHHGGLLRLGGVTLLSASPERFLSVGADGVVETSPIKGTRPRGATTTADADLAHELLASEKERAENLMIVDLMRNDIARVSVVGSVEVTSLLAVESYAQVHQLVSTVRGRLAPGLDALDAVAACFPAGSMTGAPKRRAIEILDALERRPRGVYAGAFGYLGLDGSLELAMVIRSIVMDDDGASIGAGGGITTLSEPRAEVDEVRLKARALLAALGVAG